MATKPMTWQQLKDFANSLPEEKMSCPAIVWGEDEGFTIQGTMTLEEDYVRTDQGAVPYSVMANNLEEDETMEDYPVILVKGDPILLTGIWAD